MTGIPADRLGARVTAEERERLLRLLKSLRFNIQGPLPMASAMVIAGGVALDEIDPQTMASRLVKGLFFCGEVVDVDGGSGGYNLQAAFSTGYVAGEHACRAVLGRTA
jgi:predicted flavoprotein YhiN